MFSGFKGFLGFVSVFLTFVIFLYCVLVFSIFLWVFVIFLGFMCIFVPLHRILYVISQRRQVFFSFLDALTTSLLLFFSESTPIRLWDPYLLLE